jgi:hypothetical protein
VSDKSIHIMTQYRQSFHSSVVMIAAGVLLAGCASASDNPPSASQPSAPNSSTDQEPQLLALSGNALSALPPTESAKITAYLANRAPANAIVANVTLNNDIFDCVLINEQLSIRKLKAQGANFVLHHAPSSILPAPTAPVTSAAGTMPLANEALQATNVHCPDATVPVKRIQPTQIAAWGTLDNYLHRSPPNVGQHDHAADWFSTTNYGAESRINIWNPYIENSGEFSISQIWVQTTYNNLIQSVEAGVQRWYGGNTEFFIYYTPDGYASGAYNDDDGTFIQTDNSVYLGGDFSNYSSFNGTQWDQFIGIMKDGLVENGDSGDWWIRFADKWVGYWPTTLFGWETGTLGANAATRFAFGGEVYDNRATGHTGTNMGSGLAPYLGYQNAAYQKKLRYYPYVGGGGYNWSDVDVLSNTGQAEQPNCYSQAYTTHDLNWSDYIFFGGAGRNASCP